MDFVQVINTLEGFGLTDALLPFLLIFTLIFAILQKVKIFGADKKNINVIISLIMGLLVVIPHVTQSYPPGQDVVEIMNNAIPNVSIVVVAILMVLILIGVLGKRVELGDSSLSGWIAFIAFLAVGFIFGRAAGWFTYMPNWLRFLDDPETQALLVVLLVFGILIWLVTKEPKKPGKSSGGEGLDKFGKEFGKLLKS